MTLYSPSDCPVNMTGRTLARNGYSKSQRAAFAASVAYGEAALAKPTIKQFAKLFNVSVQYIQKAMALSPVERAMMRSGLMEIADIPPSKTELKRTIARAGVEPTWQALCDQL